MTVQSFVMIRAEGDGTDESPFGPRAADLAPYTSLSWSDATGRASDISDGPLFLSRMQTEPRVMILDANMSNPDGVAMLSDNKLWMIASRRYDTEGELVEDDYDEPYTAQERTTRLAQLVTFTDFDSDTIATWWTPDKTRQEVAVKLRNYLRTLNA